MQSTASARPSRRQFLRQAATSAVALPFLAPLLRGAPQAPDGKPWNVLFLAIDDLNDWVGAYRGHPQARTPNIDRFAGTGTLFARAYCPAPICNPARTALLTGLRPSFSGVYHNRIYFPDLPWMDQVVTLPEHFAANGYHTYGGGKIFHHAAGKFAFHDRWGEVYSDSIGTAWPEGDFPKVDWGQDSGAKGRFWYWGPIEQPKEETADWQTCAAAANILRRPAEAPFFLACGISRPHLPFFAPQEFFHAFPLGEIILPAVYQHDLEDVPIPDKAGWDNHRMVVEQGHWERAVQAYLASTMFADACIGQVLDALEASPQRDRTIVMLWSDHGWHLGEKEHWAKFTLWNEANHCPLLVRVPGMTAPGSHCPHPVSLQDLYPTLVELCDLPPRAHHPLHGRSLVPLLKNPTAPWPYPAVMTHGFNNHAVRGNRWTYIRYRGGEEELYDIRHDPHEWHNLASRPEHAETITALRRWLPTFNRPLPST